MKTIVQNERYTIQIDQEKNRLYLTLIGYWKDRSVAPDYLRDLKNAVRSLSQDYTILTDVTQMKTPPQDIVNLHLEAQKQLIADGLKKTAELVGHDIIAKMALDRFSKESGMTKGSFDDKKEAEAWLDKDV